MEKGKIFIAYSLAVDKSSDTSDTAQLSIFIRGVDSESVHYRGLNQCMAQPWEKKSLKRYPKCK